MRQKLKKEEQAKKNYQDISRKKDEEIKRTNTGLFISSKYNQLVGGSTKAISNKVSTYDRTSNNQNMSKK